MIAGGHLYEAGDGQPAVVIVPALNGSILEWLHIVREVQHDTLVCVYDRAGIGWSDPPPSGRLSITAMAADLCALLGAAGVPPPYIVAGHSLGAWWPAGSRPTTPSRCAGWSWSTPATTTRPSGFPGGKVPGRT